MNDIKAGRPKWVAVIAVAFALPLLAFPVLMDMIPDDGINVALLKIYPIYVIVSCVLAWMCYPQRRDMMWILLILVLLSHASMWSLACL